ncbi:unnamed protein product [Lupinus luteus]|uniref:Uncharacterized protein n=1 Tax=Lupinus luteus TaxID=3873 RepID=A0AAV1Y3S1_LUPLU
MGSQIPNFLFFIISTPIFFILSSESHPISSPMHHHHQPPPHRLHRNHYLLRSPPPTVAPTISSSIHGPPIKVAASQVLDLTLDSEVSSKSEVDMLMRFLNNLTLLEKKNQYGSEYHTTESG